MANTSGDGGAFAPILAAMNTMQSNVQGKEKADAHEYLEKFQKSVYITEQFILVYANNLYRRKHGISLMLYCKMHLLQLKPGYSPPQLLRER